MQLALRGSDGDQLISLSPQQVLARTALPGDLQAPLGSLWKLFVYAYLADQQRPEQPYVCKGQDRDEVYCCAPAKASSATARWRSPAACTSSRRGCSWMRPSGRATGRRTPRRSGCRTLGS